jgi:hypothetical protein
MKPGKEAQGVWLVVGLFLICVGMYAGAYLVLHTPVPDIPGGSSPSGIFDNKAEYRIRVPFLDREAQQRVFQWVFWPLHAVDRHVRPELWYAPEIVINSTDDEFDAELEADQRSAVL